MSDQNSLLPTDLIFPKEIKNLLRNMNISFQINSNDIAKIANVTNSRLVITLQTKLQDVYYFCKIRKNSMLDVWKKTFFTNLCSLFLKIEKSGGFYFLRMPPNVSIVI